MHRNGPNYICNELEWLNDYGSHIERLKQMRPYMKFKANFKLETSPHKKFYKDSENQKIISENSKILRRLVAASRSSFNFSRYSRNKSKCIRSLNENYRHKIDNQIIQENKLIARRIINVKSVYNIRKFEQSHQQHIIRVQRISKEGSKFY